MQENRKIVRKLQNAIYQRFGVRLLINSRQFYTKEGKALTCYVILRQEADDSAKKQNKTEIFSSYSMLQIVLYLRDYWYNLNEWEIPENKLWEEVKARYAERGKPVGVRSESSGKRTV